MELGWNLRQRLCEQVQLDKAKWYKLKVAKLAKSFGLPSNPSKAYATSATSSPEVHTIRNKAILAETRAVLP